MESSSHKLYHEEEFQSRTFLDTYLSNKPEMVFGDETLKYPMEKLHYVFSVGNIKGDVVFDISIGSFIYHLYSACNIFKEIRLLRFTEECIMELNRWLHTRTGAFDWDHTSTFHTELEETSDQCEDKEIRLKTAIKGIVKCDIEKENLTDPVVLPQADCVISVGLLEVISKDQDDYIRNLKKFVKLLKPGGHLILIGGLNSTYFMVGQERFHVLKYDENYVRGVLTGEGFIIDYCDILRRKSVSDLIDYKATIFISAHKEK